MNPNVTFQDFAQQTPEVGQLGPFNYDAALRQRLAQINDQGVQQNAYAQNQALVAQQRAIDAQNKAMQEAQRQGQSNFSPVGAQQSSGPTGTNGKYASNPNPRSVDQALAFAKQAVANGDTGWYHRCLAFVAQAYGLASGSPTATAAYQLARSRGQINTNQDPNIGAVVYWNTGASGHAALYAGNGMVYSTDITGKGRVGLVPISQITKQWGAPYLGWQDPYFAASPRR